MSNIDFLRFSFGCNFAPLELHIAIIIAILILNGILLVVLSYCFRSRKKFKTKKILELSGAGCLGLVASYLLPYYIYSAFLHKVWKAEYIDQFYFIIGIMALGFMPLGGFTSLLYRRCHSKSNFLYTLSQIPYLAGIFFGLLMFLYLLTIDEIYAAKNTMNFISLNAMIIMYIFGINYMIRKKTQKKHQ